MLDLLKSPSLPTDKMCLRVITSTISILEEVSPSLLFSFFYFPPFYFLFFFFMGGGVVVRKKHNVHVHIRMDLKNFQGATEKVADRVRLFVRPSIG